MSTMGQPSQPKKKFTLPTWASIMAVIGVLGAILTVCTGITTLVEFWQSQNGGNNLSDEAIQATFSALQGQKDRAELQLTQFFLAQQQSANEATMNAINLQRATAEGLLSTANAQQDNFINTQNAIAAQKAAEEASNATATQAYLDAGATSAALSQIPPTDTPPPTPTPTAAPVADYRSLTGANAQVDPGGMISLSVQTAQRIPDQPGDGMTYSWLLDTDNNPATGQPVQDIGVDMRISARFDQGSWSGTVRAVLVDGSEGTPSLFADILVDGATLTATLDPSNFGLSPNFQWVVRSRSDQEVYTLLPEVGHFTLQ